MLPVELSCAPAISISKPSLNCAGLLSLKFQIFLQVPFKGFFSSGKQSWTFSLPNYISTSLSATVCFAHRLPSVRWPSAAKQHLCLRSSLVLPLLHLASLYGKATQLSPADCYLHDVCNISSSWHEQMPRFPSHTGGTAVFNHSIICKYIIPSGFFPITLWEIQGKFLRYQLQ